jgi:deoxyribonuclease-4
MQKIFLGPAGVGIGSKDRSTLGGLEYVKEIGLNAMEVEFVRGVKMNPKLAEGVGMLAKELKINLSVHAPYYINLCSKKKQIIEASKRMILDSADRAERMGAGAVAIHTAYYSGLTPKQAFEMVKQGFEDILDEMKVRGIKNVKLGAETMGRWSQFGSLEETIALSKQLKQAVIPLIDWSHLYVRGKGMIDYAKIFDALKPLKLDHIYSHFQNVKKNKEGEWVDIHVPINGHPPFELLAKEVLKRKVDITIISESPILEQDSLKMKRIFNILGYEI